MKIYALLFALGFANEALLTSYYINAAKGKRWLCVLLSLAQQAVYTTAVCFTLVDVEPLSREQFLRWGISALSYGCATAFVVKPHNGTSDTSSAKP